jgi:hypothetical protein
LRKIKETQAERHSPTYLVNTPQNCHEKQGTLREPEDETQRPWTESRNRVKDIIEETKENRMRSGT